MSSHQYDRISQLISQNLISTGQIVINGIIIATSSCALAGQLSFMFSVTRKPDWAFFLLPAPRPILDWQGPPARAIYVLHTFPAHLSPNLRIPPSFRSHRLLAPRQPDLTVNLTEPGSLRLRFSCSPVRPALHYADPTVSSTEPRSTYLEVSTSTSPISPPIRLHPDRCDSEVRLSLFLFARHLPVPYS